MDALFTTFLSILFKLLTGLIVIILILDIAKHFTKKRFIESVLSAPEEKRQILIRSDSTLISVYKILFWLTPLYLLAILATYIFVRHVFLYVAAPIIILYIVGFEDYLYRKSVLNALVSRK